MTKTLLARIAKVLPFLAPKELCLAEKKRKMQRSLQDKGMSRAAAMRAVSEHFKVAKHDE
jgi:hypothetical protein